MGATRLRNGDVSSRGELAQALGESRVSHQCAHDLAAMVIHLQ